jgi:hypothetical protein
VRKREEHSFVLFCFVCLFVLNFFYFLQRAVLSTPLIAIMDPNQLKFYGSLSHFFTFSLPLPRGNPDFQGAFKSFLGQSESTAKLIASLSKGRIELGNILQNHSTSFENKLLFVDNYLPLVYQLYESLLANGQPVKSDKELVFEWKLYLAPGNQPNFRSSDLQFEMMMLLHLKVIYGFLVFFFSSFPYLFSYLGCYALFIRSSIP